jgi:hypothetical protein
MMAGSTGEQHRKKNCFFYLTTLRVFNHLFCVREREKESGKEKEKKRKSFETCSQIRNSGV